MLQKEVSFFIDVIVGSLAESSNVSVCEESPRDVVGGMCHTNSWQILIVTCIRVMKVAYQVSDHFLPAYIYLTYGGLVRDLPPNETLQGINLDVNSEQEGKEAFAIFNQIRTLAGAVSEDEDDDDSATRMFYLCRTRNIAQQAS